MVNDFHLQIPGLRSLMEKGGVSLPFVGVYHSIDGYNSDNQEITKFQRDFMLAARQLDYLFLSEPKPEHGPSYALDSGTTVIPVDPIVRQPTLDAATVKAQLGLDPEDEFIYLQGGGRINGQELEQVALSLQNVSLGGLRIVTALNGSNHTDGNSNVVYIRPRHDGHNLIAASAGVISKPGMGIVCEAIASRKPLLLVDYPTAEARTKFEMMRDILGGDLSFRLDIGAETQPQIARWLDQSNDISDRFASIPCMGARIVASTVAKM
jgi:hypothetical protein